MTMRENLIKLLLKVDYALDTDGKKARDTAEFIADYLIANGVTVLPCKVGDMLYTILIRGIDDYFIRESVVSKIEICEDFGLKITERRKDTSGAYFYYKIDIDQIGKSIFLTKEDAEAHLPQPPKGE